MSQPGEAEVKEVRTDVLQLITEMDRALNEPGFGAAVFGVFNECGRSILQTNLHFMRDDP
jgi:hypothetical protein